MKDLFGIDLETSSTCEESDETAVEASTVYTFKCNISQDVNHLHDGFKIGLCEDREKRSEKLGRLALFKGESRITTLPKYLSVQLVRKPSKQRRTRALSLSLSLCVWLAD